LAFLAILARHRSSNQRWQGMIAVLCLLR